MNPSRISAAFRTLDIYADSKEPGERKLLHHVIEDLKDAVFGETEVDGLVKLERDLVAAGQTINAIKEMRNRFSGTADERATLKGAKDVVDAYVAKHPPVKKEG